MLKGTFFDPISNVIRFSISKCSNATTPGQCTDSASIDNFFDTYLITHKYFYGTFYLLSNRFGLSEEYPTQKYIDRSGFLLEFSDTCGTDLLLEIGTYEIKTDQNFMPWPEYNVT